MEVVFTHKRLRGLEHRSSLEKYKHTIAGSVLGAQVEYTMCIP